VNDIPMIGSRIIDVTQVEDGGLEVDVHVTVPMRVRVPAPLVGDPSWPLADEVQHCAREQLESILRAHRSRVLRRAWRARRRPPQ